MLNRVRVVLGSGSLAMAVALSSLSWSGLASALGMGEITLHSALNQPLNARIQLIETAGLDAEDVVVKLASAEAFAKAGVDRSFFLNDLRFTPVIRGNSGVIEVVSSKAVVEPYLNFLVQLSRPNGDLLHQYTLLLDPATSPQGLAATRSRTQSAQQASAQDSRMPVAPPAATQGKHYTVVAGDTLGNIARRVQGPSGKPSATQLAEGIQALNPLAFPGGANNALKPGQSLLLPDAAVLPTAPVAQPTAPAPQQSTEQLAGDALENQQLERSVEELQSLNRNLQEQVLDRDKAVTVLQARLAEQRDAQPVATAPVTAPVTAPQVAAPVVAPVVTPAPVEENPLLSLPVLLGLAVLMLLLALLLVRRRQQKATQTAPVVREDPLIKPAQATALPIYEIPAVAPQQPTTPAKPAPSLSKASATARMAGTVPDALDGVSIYIAYGRFNEALGILRDALAKQPEREDIRTRILELLAEQGDIVGFEREERTALESGMSAEAVQAIRTRYPQLKASQEPAPGVAGATAAVAGAAAIAGAAALSSSAPEPLPTLAPQVPAQLDETAAAALNPEHADEFQLNLDDLSMDADWDLVDPFDKPAAHGKAQAPAVVETDPDFASNLTQLPEVFEMQDEPFLDDLSLPEFEIVEPIEPSAVDLGGLDMDLLDGLGDFPETASSGIEAIELVEPVDNDALDEAFLDSFADENGMEFDLLDLDEEPLTQINQAQLMIDEGDTDGARRLLLQVIDESDEAHQQMARDLLSSLD